MEYFESRLLFGNLWATVAISAPGLRIGSKQLFYRKSRRAEQTRNAHLVRLPSGSGTRYHLDTNCPCVVL